VGDPGQRDALAAGGRVLTVLARVHGGLTTKETELVSIKNPLARAATVGVLAVTAMAGVIVPASAASSGVGAGLAGATAAAKPNVNIQGSPAKWSPTKLTVTPKNFTKCTPAKVVWTISNKTKKPAVISWRVGSGPKMPLGTLPAGEKAGVCSKGPAGTKESFSIKGSKSILQLTLR
jgi:hypothetical protein